MQIRSRSKDGNLSALELQLVETIRDGEALGANAIATKLDITYRAFAGRLTRLCDKMGVPKGGSRLARLRRKLQEGESIRIPTDCAEVVVATLVAYCDLLEAGIKQCSTGGEVYGSYMHAPAEAHVVAEFNRLLGNVRLAMATLQRALALNVINGQDDREIIHGASPTQIIQDTLTTWGKPLCPEVRCELPADHAGECEEEEDAEAADRS